MRSTLFFLTLLLTISACGPDKHPPPPDVFLYPGQPDTWALIGEPQFHWSISGRAPAAWQIRVSNQKEELSRHKGNMWDSGKQPWQGQPTPYQGAPLQSGRKYFWQARIWDSQGIASAWSPVAWFEPIPADSLLDASLPWLTLSSDLSEPAKIKGCFRHEKEVRKARLYLLGGPLDKVLLNGHLIPDSLINALPFQDSLHVQALALTPAVRWGDNCLELIVRGKTKVRGFLAFTDGETTFFSADSTWSVEP